ncbi:Oidioi.mRNA.OKI2018_I69.XSR.g15311.t1.cds [Oikopleura dioica]|uniref:Oidioi.mRNA.OKI2018_I69.XSR.g15311.t1.cds n=1 Tax=Oikopleura dioica TaxID=34765 RepID=A0ABN7SHH4_OIKDI|nr:Oidioi.mRNA.OKI2018_I69.XSR.g15311.t1.cds [Oikopleura dioica]
MVDTNEVESHLIERYEIRRRLGKGAYGIVWKANERKTGRVVALKKIFDAFRNPTDAQRTFREILFLQEFADHPNIIKLLNVVAAKNDKDIYLVFEYMETDLHAVIRKGGILQDAHQRYIMAQLMRATAFLHSGNVIHRDHKPSNVLLDSDCAVKICDFGLARSLSSIPKRGQGDDTSVPALTEYVATRWYRAPEILLSSPHYTKGVDMWSLGCILAEMLLGKPLFPGDSTFDQIEKIIRVIPQPSRLDIDVIGSQYALSVVERAQRKQRVTLEQILPKDSPKDGIDLIKQLLVFNPEKRPSAESCLSHPYVARFNTKKEPLDLGYQVIPPIDDDVQLSVDEYRSKLYKMIREKKAARDLERERRYAEEQAKKTKKEDLNRTLTNSYPESGSATKQMTSTGTAPVYPAASVAASKPVSVPAPYRRSSKVVAMDKGEPSRHSRSAQNLAPHQSPVIHSRHSSAPLHRQNTREFTKQQDRLRQNSNIIRKNSHSNNNNGNMKDADLSVTGKVVGTKSRSNFVRTTGAKNTQPHRSSSGTYKNMTSSGNAARNTGSSHSQQYGTVTAKWLNEHN